MVDDPAPSAHDPADADAADASAAGKAAAARIITRQVPPPSSALPAPLRSLADARAYLGWASASARNLLIYHAVRSPVHVGHAFVAVSRGTLVVLTLWWPWVRAAEYHDARAAKSADVTVITKQAQVRKTRSWLSVIMFLAGLGLFTWARLSWGLKPALAATAALAVVVFAAAGRRTAAAAEEGRGPVLPARVDAGYIAERCAAAGWGEVVAVSDVIREGKDAWSVTVQVSPVMAARVLARKVELAAALARDTTQVILSKVPGRDDLVRVWSCETSPWDRAPQPSPYLLQSRAQDFFQPGKVGVDVRGHDVALALPWASLLIGGLPQMGKSTAQRNVLAAMVLCPFVRIYLADAKDGSDWQGLHRLAYRAAGDSPREFVDLLREVHEEMRRRYVLFRTLGVQRVPEGRLTPELARSGIPVIVVAVDELQEYLSSVAADLLDETPAGLPPARRPAGRNRDEIIALLESLLRKGPAAGIHLVLATQRPKGDEIPTGLRDLIALRWALKTFDDTSSDLVLGKGSASQRGLSTARLRTEHKGVGILSGDTGDAVDLRSYVLTAAQFDQLVQAAEGIRRAAGYDARAAVPIGAPGLDGAGTSSDSTTPHILRDAIMAMGERDRIHTEELLHQLAAMDSGYRGLDPGQLARLLAGAGVSRSREQLKIGGVNRQGWLLTDLQRAVAARRRR